MTAVEGWTLVGAMPGLAVEYRMFLNAFWREALGRLPPHIRELRNEMTRLRPGDGNLPRTVRDKAYMKQCVSEIRRDHPLWHRGQIMDEIRRITPFQFQDPVAFERNYILGVGPAPQTGARSRDAPAPPAEGEGPRIAILPSDDAGALPRASASGIPARELGPRNLFDTLAAASNPLVPVETHPASDGRLEVRLNLGEMDLARFYGLMASLYTGLEKQAGS